MTNLGKFLGFDLVSFTVIFSTACPEKLCPVCVSAVEEP